MPISGSDKAPTVARLGVMRLGATRLDYYQPSVHVTVNGVDRAANMRISGVTINDYLDGTPNTMTCRVEGFTPTLGHEIKVALGQMDAAHILFAGHIVEMTQVYEGLQANVAFDLVCTDYTFLLDRRLVTKTYTSQSATAIAQDLISTFTSGFTSTGVESGLATIDEISFTRVPVTEALNRLAKRGGWYWVVDSSKNLRFGATLDDGTAVPITDTVKAGMRDLKWTTDITQAKTRVTVEGANLIVLAPMQSGLDFWIPVSTLGSLTSGTAGLTTVTGLSGFKYNGQTLTNFANNVHDNKSKAGFGRTVSDVAAEATSMVVEISVLQPVDFSANGWIEVAGQFVYYGASSNAGTQKTLTSIRTPSSNGIGTITADIPAGSVVRFLPMVRSINGSLSPIQVDIAAGERITCDIVRNDTAAQTALAALVGGDGIHEDVISDNRLSIAEAADRGDAYLDLVSDPMTTARYATRDQSTRSGRTVSITLGAPTSVSGTLRIQQVTITELGESSTVFPLRQVDASSRRYSLEGLLRQIKGERVA